MRGAPGQSRALTARRPAAQCPAHGMGDEPTTDSTALEHLQATLESALELTRDLAADPLLVRLLSVFRSLPAEDRPAILGALEREAAARKLSLATEGMTGQSMVPNPNARFYLRAHENAFDRNMLERDEMMIATVRGMRAASLIPLVPDIYAMWREATREAMEHVDASTRAVVDRLVRDVLGFLADADRPAAAEPAPAPPEAGATHKDARES